MKSFCALILICGPALSPVATQSRSASQGINATLSSESFSYRLACKINGQDVGFKGGGQDVIRFVADSRYLHPGRNTVVITYTRIAEEPRGFGLNVQLTVPGYPAPLFYAHVRDAASGTLEGAFDIAGDPPKAFKPVYLSQYPNGASGFIYLDQDPTASGEFALSVNGDDDGTSYQGRLRYAVPLPRLHPGANQITVTYRTHAGPVRLFVVGPTGTSAMTLASEQQTTRSFTVLTPAS